MKCNNLKGRLISLLTAITMLTALFGIAPITVNAAEDITTISSVSDLIAFRDDVNAGNLYEGKTVTLTGDIDLDGSSKNEWTPIGDKDKQFSGTFDGGNHKITGLYINNSQNYQGLFGYVGKNGTIKNLGVSGVVDCLERVGGVVGENDGALTNCYSTAAVSGSYDVGGVVGRNNEGGTVTNCHNTGKVAGSTEAVGGIVGYNATDAKIVKCYNTGNVNSDEYLGGIAGYNYGTVENCYNTGKVTVSKEIGGGIVGYNYTNKTVTNCYNTGIVKTDLRTGGVVGENRHGTGEYLGIVTNCYYLNTSATEDDNAAEITAAQLASQSTFSGWDFGSIWTMSSEHGRPILTDHREPNPIVMEGDGTEGNPYKISSRTILEDLRHKVNNGEAYTGKFFELTTDIDLDGSASNPWETIGTESKNFKGNFDGCDHKVSGLYIKNSEDYQGLFGYVGNEGSIKNLIVEGNVSSDDYAGGVVGYIGGTIKNCSSECTVSGGDYVGGVVGYVKGAVTNCHNSANVSGNDYVGGIIGYSYDDVRNCDNSGEVEGSSHVGGVIGIAGRFSSKIMIENCYNTGVVDGSVNAGGMVGRCRLDGSIENCYNIGMVKGIAYIGGVIGLSAGSTESCYYLKGTALGGIGGADYEGETEAKTLEQFASGEVAYLMQKTQTEMTWGQKLTGNKDVSPVLTSDSEKNVYKVTFETYDTNEYAVKYGNPAGVEALPQEPARFNYTFKQWSADKTGGTAFIASTPLTGDITIYAQFTKNKLFQNGDGTKENPFEISTLAELEVLRDDVNAGESYKGQYIKLTADIDLGCDKENPWKPIGRNNRFYGVFDGGNHKITGLYTNSKNNYQGLFGALGRDGVIKNLSVEGTAVGENYVGGIVGDSDGTVENCNYKGTVKGSVYVGGIVGYSDDYVINCYNTGAVSGEAWVGGIVGLGYYGLGYYGAVTNCYNTGTVIGNSHSGGIIGDNRGTVANCYYLAGAATGGINGGDVSGQAEAKTDEQLASGEVAYLLQKGQTEQVWGQTLSGAKDINPILTSDSAKNVYKVTFMANGAEHAVKYGNSAGVGALPGVPEKSGYVFTKWSTAETGGTDFTAATPITNDTTVYAQFHKHTLVYHAASASTCVEAGTGEYWRCEGEDGCNKMFQDAEGATEIYIIPAGESAKGHNYGAWEFSSTSTAATVTRTCTNDPSHQEIRNAEFQLVIPTPYTYSGEECKPKASVKVFNGAEEITLTENTDYTLSYENNINAGTATVKITGIGDYSGTVEKTFTIGAKTITAVAATTENKTYDGTKTVNVTAVTLDGVIEGDNVPVDLANLTGTLVGADAGSYTEVTLNNLTLINNENNNYKLSQTSITVPTEVTIEKADVPISAIEPGKPLSILNNLEKEYAYLPARLLPNINWDSAAIQKVQGSLSYEIVSVDLADDYYTSDTAHIDKVAIQQLDGAEVNLFYLPIKSFDTQTTGEVGTVTIKITSKNYNDFTNTFDIVANNKASVTFGGVTAQNGTYSGEAQNGYTGDLTITNGEGSSVDITPEILYSGILDTDYSESATPPTNAGTYAVTFSVPDTDTTYMGSHTEYFKIEKAAGDASVAMDNFNCGQTAIEPVPISDTNGTDGVTYMYKPQNANDSEYTSTKPSVAGEYTVKAIFAETQNYNQVEATADFTIEHDYSDKWSNDALKHWHKCLCGSRSDEAAHTWDEGTVTQAATCTLDGIKQYSCTVCGYQKIEIEEALGHDWGDWTITKDPMLEATGAAEHTCQRDNAHKETISIPALSDETVWTAGEKVEPTETTEGSQIYKSVYGDVTVMIPMLEHMHDWSDWEIIAEPSLASEGRAERICAKNNNHKELLALPALTDATFWTAGTRVEPTDTTEGSQVYTSIYGDVTLVLPALKFGVQYKGDFAVINAPFEGTYTIIFAAYDEGGSLTSLSVKTITAEIPGKITVEPTNFTPSGTVKVMLWDSLESMKPLCEAAN